MFRRGEDVAKSFSTRTPQTPTPERENQIPSKTCENRVPSLGTVRRARTPCTTAGARQRSLFMVSISPRALARSWAPQGLRGDAAKPDMFGLGLCFFRTRGCCAPPCHLWEVLTGRHILPHCMLCSACFWAALSKRLWRMEAAHPFSHAEPFFSCFPGVLCWRCLSRSKTRAVHHRHFILAAPLAQAREGALLWPRALVLGWISRSECPALPAHLFTRSPGGLNRPRRLKTLKPTCLDVSGVLRACF